MRKLNTAIIEYEVKIMSFQKIVDSINNMRKDLEMQKSKVTKLKDEHVIIVKFQINADVHT